MGYAVIAEVEPKHAKSKERDHIPGVTPYIRGGSTGDNYMTGPRAPGKRVAKYRKQLRRDGIQFLEEHHPPGRLESYPDSMVTVFTWVD